MSTEYIKDKSGFVIGEYVTNGSVVTLNDKSGFALGSYDSTTNKTYNNSGFVVGEGNQLFGFLLKNTN